MVPRNAGIAGSRIGASAGGGVRAEPGAQRPWDRGAVGRGPAGEFDWAPLGAESRGARSTVRDHAPQYIVPTPAVRSPIMHAWTHERLATLNADSPSLIALLP